MLASIVEASWPNGFGGDSVSLDRIAAMRQRIYFSGEGERDPWRWRFLEDVPRPVLNFLAWDATPDLAQATWEWPGETPYVAVNVVEPFDFEDFERCPCGCQMPMSAPSYEEAHRSFRHGLWY